MIETVYADFLLNIGVGASVAWVARSSLPFEKLWRTTALWALLSFELMLFGPIGAYLLVRYPDWSLMYLVDPAALPFPAWWLAFLYPIGALIGFLVSRLLLMRRQKWPVLGLFLIGAIGGIGVMVVLADRSLALGTYAAFNAGKSMPSALNSPLPYFLGGAIPIATVGWAAVLWRLRMLGRSLRYKHAYARSDTLIRTGRNAAAA